MKLGSLLYTVIYGFHVFMRVFTACVHRLVELIKMSLFEPQTPAAFSSPLSAAHVLRALARRAGAHLGRSY